MIHREDRLARLSSFGGLYNVGRSVVLEADGYSELYSCYVKDQLDRYIREDKRDDVDHILRYSTLPFEVIDQLSHDSPFRDYQRFILNHFKGAYSLTLERALSYLPESVNSSTVNHLVDDELGVDIPIGGDDDESLLTTAFIVHFRDKDLYWWFAIKNFIRQFIYFNNDISLFRDSSVRNSHRQLVHCGDQLFINVDWSMFSDHLHITGVESADELVLLNSRTLRVEQNDKLFNEADVLIARIEEV